MARLADQCIEEDIALVAEPVSYPIEDKKNGSSEKSDDMKPDLVIETARQVTPLPIDALKAEFPVDIRTEHDDERLLRLCQELNQASRLPWVLLSAGVDFDSFKRQVAIACKAGASGFLAGRALWQEGAQIHSRKERVSFFRNTTAARLRDLTEIADSYGKPWYFKPGAEQGMFAPVIEGWNRRY